MRLNLGCGHIHAPSWVNVDNSNRAWLASRLPWLDKLLVSLRCLTPTEFNAQTVYADLLRRLPWEDQTVEAIYLGEVLEHFTLDDGRRVLQECYRVLKPEGTLRIRVPDQVRFWRNYLQEYDQIKQQPREHWSLEHTRWTAMYFRDLCVSRPHFAQSMGHYHKWMYDEVSLILLVTSLGFQDVERQTYHHSRIPDIAEVETRGELIVEAKRPATP